MRTKPGISYKLNIFRLFAKIPTSAKHRMHQPKLMNYEENIWNNDVTEAPQPDVKDTPEIEQYREKSHQIHSTYIP